MSNKKKILVLADHPFSPSGVGTQTIREFIDCVSEIAAFDLMKYVVVDEKLMRPSEVPLLLADPTKAKEKLGWQAKTTLKELAEIMYNNDLAKEKLNVK